MEKTEIIGNLTKDPELRTTQTGLNVCSFTVAVNQRQSKARREAGQEPQAKYYRVTVWRELAEICNKYLAKGRKVFVEGTVNASAYIGQDGKPHASLELTADNVEFLSSRSDTVPDSQSTETAPQAPAQSAPAPSAPTGFTPVETDDLPF